MKRGCDNHPSMQGSGTQGVCRSWRALLRLSHRQKPVNSTPQPRPNTTPNCVIVGVLHWQESVQALRHVVWRTCRFVYHPQENKYSYKYEINSKTRDPHRITNITDLVNSKNIKSALNCRYCRFYLELCVRCGVVCVCVEMVVRM